MQWPWRKAETELDREMQFHLDELAAAFEREGLSRDEARARARREFGGVDLAKEQCRDERRWQPLATLEQDVRFGLRMMRRAPLVTAAAVLSLALGIGANTAILSLMQGLLWRTLDAPAPEQISEVLWEAKANPDGLYESTDGNMFRDGAGVAADYFSVRAFETLRDHAAGRAQIAAHQNQGDVSVRSKGRAAVVAPLRAVSGNFFPMLQVQPQLGRLLAPADDRAEAAPTVVLTHQFWETHLGSDPAIVGRALRINDRSYTVAGVLQRGFTGIRLGDTTDLYTSLRHAPDWFETSSWIARNWDQPRSWFLHLIARRSPGVNAEAVARSLDPVFASTWEGTPKQPATAPRLRFQDGSHGLGDLRREFGNPFAVLLTLVTLVLLVACANIANLLLARADARRHEVSIRASLGSGRARLIRQFLTESLLLALAGGVLSMAVALATARGALALLPGEIGAFRLELAFDGRAAAYTLALMALTALLFGLYPALRVTRVNLGAATSVSLAPGRLLIAAQVSIGVLLLAAAFTFTGRLADLANRDTGMARSRLLLFDLKPGQSGYEGRRLRQFSLDLERKLGEIPGVEAVALARVRPLSGGGWGENYQFDGQPKAIPVLMNAVTSGYFSAMGIDIKAGRGLTPRDSREQAQVAVVSEDLARQLGPRAIGARFRDGDRTFEVVGIARNARYDSMSRESAGVLYLPHPLEHNTMTVVVRTRTAPAAMIEPVRRAVGGLDAALPIVNALTMDQQIGETLRRERLFAWLCGCFGGLALVLCAIGLYGVLSYATARRAREIGIRMALGATREAVLRAVLGEGLALACAGLAVGAPLAWFLARRYVDHERFGLERSLEAAPLGWAVAVLAVAALVATLLPALRASSADPARVLREN